LERHEEGGDFDAEHVMSMVEFLEHRVQSAAEPLVLAHAEDLSDDVGRQAEHPQFTRALEDLVDREMAAEDEIPTVLDLVQRVGTPQVDRRPLLLRKLRVEHQSPVLEPLLNHGGIEPIGRRLQRLQIGRPAERVIVGAEPNPSPLPLPGDDVVPVEVAGGLEREEGSDTQHEWPESLVPDVKVVVGVAGALSRHP
jgi:hypothetical protein